MTQDYISPVPVEPSAQEPRRFVFVLLNEFTLFAVATATECLRVANRMSGKQLYSWASTAESLEPVVSSAGIAFPVDIPFDEVTRDDTLIVCGGLNIQSNSTAKTMGWLRKISRQGVKIGSLCAGAHALAKAGLLDGHRATIHWENQDGFIEDFPEIQLTRSVFAIDRNRFTAAGGTASIDLMLRMIADDHGTGLSNAVADQFIYSSIRTDQDFQRLSTPTRMGVRHPRLGQVIDLMEANIEEPVSPSELAESVGMSTRQLERLFRRYLDRSPKRYYMELRLGRARNLLMQTDMSIINVAIACGFSSPSHFSKCYRTHYGITPYRERGSMGSSGS
ncbi:GlxA family transcriptional regulator [Cognatishimia activa]|uniref:GlxA family transcriptional regulator n=1 Tax=Cognatishimia activa TaxID=1715691 RepID=UPI0022316348|nr:GlxA family transcriptional regulator [Cognatishimia activa]UZD92168.1 GlxA family transcriptional regulator [Cognatishimia activa]